MTNHLAELYRIQGKSIDLYRLLIEDGQWRSALEVVALNNLGPGIQQIEIETAFNLLNVEEILCVGGGSFDSSFLAKYWKEKYPLYLASASTKWNTAARILSSFKEGKNETLADLQDQTIKECLCLVVGNTFACF